MGHWHLSYMASTDLFFFVYKVKFLFRSNRNISLLLTIFTPFLWLIEKQILFFIWISRLVVKKSLFKNLNMHFLWVGEPYSIQYMYTYMYIFNGISCKGSIIHTIHCILSTKRVKLNDEKEPVKRKEFQTWPNRCYKDPTLNNSHQ